MFVSRASLISAPDTWLRRSDRCALLLDAECRRDDFGELRRRDLEREVLRVDTLADGDRLRQRTMTDGADGHRHRRPDGGRRNGERVPALRVRHGTHTERRNTDAGGRERFAPRSRHDTCDGRRLLGRRDAGQASDARPGYCNCPQRSFHNSSG